jgi:Uma2 family endonuclease
VSETARRPATWEDLLRTPDDGNTYEILDGKLEAMPRPLPRHGRAGVPHYWILDPEARTLEAYTAREAAWLRLGAWTDGDSPRILPFETLDMDVGGLVPSD